MVKKTLRLVCCFLNIFKLFNFQDVDECTLIKPCKNDGQCLNLFGSFECLCPIPYVGTTCEDSKF